MTNRRANSAKTQPVLGPPVLNSGAHGWAPRRDSGGRRTGWSLIAQVTTLVALVAMGWQAHSFVASLEREHAEIRGSVDALYSATEVLNRGMVQLRLDINKLGLPLQATGGDLL